MNGTPNVGHPAFYTSETLLQAALVLKMNSNGWTTYGPAGTNATTTTATTPSAGGAVTVWASSKGADQMRHICVGIVANNTTRRLQIYAAADLDLSALPAGPVFGVVNDDVTMTLPPASVPTLLNNIATTWLVRASTSQYRAFFGVTPNAVNLLCTYVADTNGARTQGFYGFGVPNAPVRHHLYLARARIQAIDYVSGTVGSGATYQVTLDRNINRWLKDGRQWPNETLNYVVSEPMFQAVIGAPGHAGEAGDASDISMVERIPIVANSLNLAGKFPNWVTTFKINTAVGVKLAFPGGRYDQATPRGTLSNGVGDIVSVMADPTLYYCGSLNTGGTYALDTVSAMIGSWHPNGAQIASDTVDAKRMRHMMRNADDGLAQMTAQSARSVDNDPAPGTNRATPFAAHCFPVTNFTAARVPNTDQRQKDSLGIWPDFRFFPVLAGVGNEAHGAVGGDQTQSYKIQANLGTGAGFNSLGDAVGSGSEVGRYISGIRGRWL